MKKLDGFLMRVYKFKAVAKKLEIIDYISQAALVLSCTSTHTLESVA